MKLSIVIVCWNDLKVIRDCLRSIYAGTHSVEFEVIVSDNGSTDGSVQFIRQNYPQVVVIENRANLGFSKGNNVGIRASKGEYVLILNPDTIIHDGAFDKWLQFVDRHPEAGGFGCRVLNPDGSYQGSAQPFPTILRDLIAALYLRPVAYIFERLMGDTYSDTYTGWPGNTERLVDWQCGCCVMFRGDLLRRLGGFDEQFFYHYEEVDLCRRVWQAGYPIIYTPEASITHLGGQSVNRFPIKFALERYRSRYRYFYKYYGQKGVHRCRHVVLVSLGVRQLGYGLIELVRPTEALKSRMHMYRVAAEWNRRLDPVRFIEAGEEPQVEAMTVGQPT